MKAIKDYRGNVRKSLNELIATGYTRTGHSGYSNGWASKSIWTGELLSACQELGIMVESGNDAPKGGANGEFVALSSDKRKNKKIWAEIKLAAAARLAASEKAAADLEKEVAFYKSLPKSKPDHCSWSEFIKSEAASAGIAVTLGFNQIKSIIFNG